MILPARPLICVAASKTPGAVSCKGVAGCGASASLGTKRDPLRPRTISSSSSGWRSSLAKASVTSSLARYAGKSTSLMDVLAASFIIVRPQPQSDASADQSLATSLLCSPCPPPGSRFVIAPDVIIQHVTAAFASSQAWTIMRALRHLAS